MLKRSVPCFPASLVLISIPSSPLAVSSRFYPSYASAPGDTCSPPCSPMVFPTAAFHSALEPMKRTPAHFVISLSLWSGRALRLHTDACRRTDFSTLGCPQTKDSEKMLAWRKGLFHFTSWPKCEQLKHQHGFTTSEYTERCLGLGSSGSSP